jgi:hypothetical protein
MHRFASIGKGLGAVMGIVLGAALTVSPALAASIQFNFTGEVDKVHEQLDTQFNTTQTMSGQATVNSVGSGGVYTIQDFDVNINGYNATWGVGTTGAVTIRITTAARTRSYFKSITRLALRLALIRIY